MYTFTILPSLRDWGRKPDGLFFYHTAVPTGLRKDTCVRYSDILPSPDEASLVRASLRDRGKKPDQLLFYCKALERIPLHNPG